MSGVIGIMVGMVGGTAIEALVPSGTYEHSVADPLDASCSLSFNAAGTCSVSAGVSPSSASSWKVSGGASSGYDVSFDGGGSWLNLGTTRTITVSRTAVGHSETTYDVRIRRVSDSVQVAAGSITLIADIS